MGLVDDFIGVVAECTLEYENLKNIAKFSFEKKLKVKLVVVDLEALESKIHPILYSNARSLVRENPGLKQISAIKQYHPKKFY